MSHLSQAEITAGISRRALETLKGSRNGHRATVTTKVDLSAAQTIKVGEDSVTPGQPPQRIAVVETWCSSLDLINYNGWSFAIRNTQHISERAEVTTIHVNRIELEALIHKCQEVLAENGGAPHA